jgi:hypothetical protein
MKKKVGTWSIFGNVSSGPFEKIQEELERIDDEFPALLSIVETVRKQDIEQLSGLIDLSGVDTDIEDTIALEISRRVLNPTRNENSLSGARHLVEVLTEIVRLRKLAKLRSDAEIQAFEDDYISSGMLLDDPLNPDEVLEHAQTFQRELNDDRRRVTEAKLPEKVLTTESNLRALVRGEQNLSDTKSQVTLDSMIGRFWEQVEYPNIRIPSYDQRMDFHWQSLSSWKRDKIMDDVRRTLIIWEIAKPALEDPSRPGILPALLWGLQLPFEAGNEKTLSRTAVNKTVNNLRGAWGQLLLLDPDAFLWASRVLLAQSAENLPLDSILGFATHSDWSGKKGRKSSQLLEVIRWTCSACRQSYRPGDSLHDSPRASSVTKAIERDSGAFDENGRVVKGLPAKAQRWNRLMCNADNHGDPCWWRGGVLVPIFK